MGLGRDVGAIMLDIIGVIIIILLPSAAYVGWGYWRNWGVR